MALHITQECDGCGKDRDIRNIGDEETNGWRTVFVARPGDQNPTLCRDCLDRVHHIIRMMKAGWVVNFTEVPK